MYVDKKLIALPILTIIALSIIGVGVAHWSDLININGTINMGSLTLAFVEIEPCVEYHWKDGVRYLGEPMGKDVAKPTCWLDEPVTDPHTGKSGWEKMHILIENAYPSYEVHCTWVIDNIGSVPLDVIAFKIYDPTGELTWVETAVGEGYFVDAAGKTILNVMITNTRLPYQLDPCNRNKSETDIHVKQDALECHKYQFVIEIVYSQWN